MARMRGTLQYYLFGVVSSFFDGNHLQYSTLVIYDRDVQKSQAQLEYRWQVRNEIYLVAGCNWQYLKSIEYTNKCSGSQTSLQLILKFLIILQFMIKKQRQQKTQGEFKNIQQDSCKQQILQKNIAFDNYNLSFGHSRQIRKQRILSSSIYHSNLSHHKDTANQSKNYQQTPKQIGQTEKLHPKNNHLRFKTMEVDGFKASASNIEPRYSTVKKDSKDNASQITKKQPLRKQTHFIKSMQSDTHQKQIVIQDTIIGEDQVSASKASGNGVLQLEEGWSYKGEYVQGLFDGFGELFHQNKLIYAGKFQYGYFSGYGKLQFDPLFDYLVCTKSVSCLLFTHCPSYKSVENSDEIAFSWSAYFGQFERGKINGLGQLWISTGQKIISRWHSGQPHRKHYKVISIGQIN